jgi:glycosyltransferase involved in cell wall biosynthesis
MLTVAILTHNNSETIAQTIHDLAWSNEILIIDDNSTDSTVQLAQKAGARVIIHDLKNNFAAARMLAMDEAKNDWIFFLDTDERLNAAAVSSIKKINLHSVQEAGFRIHRIDYFWNRHITHGEVRSAVQQGIIRLIHRTRGEWVGKVHERFVPTGSVGTLSGAIEHRSHRSISDFLDKINYYSDIRAAELQDQSRVRTIIEMIIFPPGKFISTYIFRLGLLDGAVGFVYSFMMSFHSFLVRAKILTRHSKYL